MDSPAPAVEPAPPAGDSGAGEAVAAPSRPAATISSAPSRDRACRMRELLDEAESCVDERRQQRLRQQVVTEYLPVARSIAARYSGRGVERSDLDQLAYLGLVKAVRRWRPGLSEDFLQFAVPTIVGEIKRYFRDHSWLVRPPRRIQELRAAINEAEQHYWQRKGARPTDTELAKLCDTTEADVVEARGATTLCRPPSLDEQQGAGWAMAQSWGAQDDEIGKIEDRMAVGRLLEALTDRERQVVELRFGQGWSQSRIGAEIGVSQMQVSRWLRAIALKLRTTWDG
ncbi:sigma-70 family RNA polymerase sigma factor [Nakamurella flava]|uniref:Sigma-70 family RNA polymerase sigma factor n=1 Tax=Nakamurella flava TaxID=2576308 RepID=A0A4U6QCJ7_9ACTN|nr:sigma-70 family RNA polymerase sigma factor [Nakamurella flava]TKV57639.1 sigma-70 family RNA polymerase sigma factor [Nakamurella flava]